MHGRREGGGEGCGKRRRLVRHMWPVTRVEAAPPPAQGQASPPSGSSVPPPPTTSYPPAPTTPPAAAHKKERIDSPRQASSDSFVKDGREFRVGDCALFQAVDVPPFIGLIRWIEKKEEGFPRLCVSWLYRPADIKLNKGTQLNAAPNEIFYSFHQDETSAVSLLHPCKVAFLRKGVELPAGISSFVCWRVYDIDNKCLWWLTDQDYINERQEEVNQLLYRTKQEMHAAVQSGGRSPKRLNGPSSAQQKSGSDGAQNCGLLKGKKRDRGEQGTDPAKRDRERPLKVEDGESGNLKVENVKSEIAKITEKGGLPNAEAVEKLVHLMQLDRTERKIDLSGRVMLADSIAATESPDCLDRFVQLRGLPVFDDWLQEAHKGKSGEGGSPKESDKPMEDLLLALLRALAKLPINLTALQSCSIGKSVNHLRSHKNLEIQKKAKCLVENWKKRVDAEMKSNEVKPVVSGQAVSWPGKPGFPEISTAGNRRSGSSEPSLKSPVSQLSSSKALTAKSGAADVAVKSSPVISGSSKLQHTQPVNVVTNLKEQPCKSSSGTCGPELPTVKEEKSSSSSQSLNNSQSCSSEHAKTIGSSKEDARSSTAASGIAGKTSSGSSRVHRRTNNGLLGSGIQKEATVARSTSLDRSLLQEKASPSGATCEKRVDIPSDQGNGHRLIVRFPNPGRSPARSASGGSYEEPSFTGSRASSPVLADKHDQTDRRVKMKTENSSPHLGADTNAESWHSNDVKGAAVSEKGDRSPRAGLTDGSRTTEEAGKDACTSRVASSSFANEKGVCSSETGLRNSFNPMNALIEIKYSEASHSLQAGDDTAMNLLASVAGEISKSELISSAASPRNSSANGQGCEGDNIGKLKVECDVGRSQHEGPSNDVEKITSEKNEKSGGGLVAKEEQHQGDVNMLAENNLLSQDKGTSSSGPSLIPGLHSKAVESPTRTENREVESSDKCSHRLSSHGLHGEDGEKSNVKQPADIKIDTVRGKVEDGCTTSSDVGTTLGSQCSLVVSNRKMLAAEDSSLCDGDKQAHGLLKSSTGQKHLQGLPDSLEAIDRSGDRTAVKVDLKSSLSSLTTKVNKTDGLLVDNTVLKVDEKKEQPSFTSADGTKQAVPAGVPHCAANGNSSIKETKDNSSESSSHAGPGGAVSQDTEHSTRRSSKKSSDDASVKEDLISSDDSSSYAAKNRSSATAKLDFDLNEGIPGDEGHQSEPATSPAVCSSAIHLPRLSPFISTISSGLPAPITVAAPAKGPFVPPENLLRLKPETGWKGSAATSAFRPAEPRKTLEMTLSAPGMPVSDGAGKHRPALDIDLNVADDQFLEEDVSQSSVQTTGSESGNTRRSNGPVRSVGIELDLNRADEVAENGQFVPNISHRVEVPLLSSRPLPGVFSSTDANGSRDFDLNNGPTLDEAGMEPAPRSLASKVTSSIPFLPQVPGVRMNSAEMSNVSPWFASANPCAPVAIQSFLPSRGEQPHPVEMAAGSGTQRIITSMADGVQHGSDPCRAPVISSSPTMVFHPPAYQYAGFPFAPGVHLQAPGFSIGSASYANSAPVGVSYFPTIAPTLVGPTGALPAQHTRQYAINLPESSSTVGHDSNRKWGRQSLDLNSGPGTVDVEMKDEQVPLPVRQNLITPPHAFVEGHTRMYQMPGVGGIKRKEPEGSWDAERSSYKQLSWQ